MLIKTSIALFTDVENKCMDTKAGKWWGRVGEGWWDELGDWG